MSRKSVKTVSPLLSALTSRHSGPLSISELTLLRCYIALDALHRGVGSNSLFAVLGQHLIMSINLCKQGYHVERFTIVREAQQGLLRLRKQVDETTDWTPDEDTYRALCNALGVLEDQLTQAPMDQFVRARALMLRLLETTRQAA
jgi:hypothetical protein